MAKVTDHIAQAKGKTLFSIEIIPPTKGSHSIDELLNGIEPMMELKPPFIDVTYHREEYRLQEMPNGEKREIKTRKRPGTVGICSAIMHKFHVDPVPHILCGGFTKDETEDLLIDLNYLGIENVMALQGDAAKPYKTFKANKYGHAYASDLIVQIKDMNAGKFLHEEIEYNFKPDFCIGGGAYPEKHFNAVSLETDMEFLKKKVDAGVDYLVTQMFFDNQKYFDFVKACRANGIHVPIIPGLKVLSTKRQAEILPDIFYLDLPADFKKAVEEAKNNEEAKKVGVEWCVAQCKELKEFGVPALHFYTMSKSTTTMAVAKEVF
ncbi:methylenetetrahydrofolate reductase [Marinilongibacter aquaticus]|uniref:methylenetetrahydrofolate reductase n=1 Tax=Marinilongibacter aquaticus TaxID=2975157 RepID=UPI0021BD3720|nr:methylenetetrahydrofolate reductase [Marinilongibacter aquaticus]UBM60287.1 methylenetetrahydrofolate reductase [Marinilongibacter aquaticus]